MRDLANPACLENCGASGDPYFTSVWIGYRHLAEKTGPKNIADSQGYKHQNHNRIICLCHLVDLRHNRECVLGNRFHQNREHVVFVAYLALGVGDQGHLLYPRDEPGQRQDRNGPEEADEQTPEPHIEGAVGK